MQKHVVKKFGVKKTQKNFSNNLVKNLNCGSSIVDYIAQFWSTIDIWSKLKMLAKHQLKHVVKNENKFVL